MALAFRQEGLRRPGRRRWRRRRRLQFQVLRQRHRRAGGARPGGLGGQRLLHRRCQPARGRDALRPLHRDHRAGPALAHALSDREPRVGESHQRADSRGRLSRRGTQYHPQRSADAHRRREHHQHPVRGAVHPEQSRELSVQYARTRRVGDPGGRDRDARDRRQEQDGLRPLRGPRRDRDDRPCADAVDPRPLWHGHPDQQGDDAERAAAGAGPGRLRRCGQGRTGPGAPAQRRPGLCQRRHPEGARYRFATAAGGRRLPRPGDLPGPG